MENHGQVFWADTIAERVKLIMRELIYKAAYNKISADLQHDHFNDLGIDPSSAAISAIMRAEALLEARELSQFHTWDEAWDRCWMRRARQSQVASRWKLLRDPKLGNLPDQNAEATPHINTTGRQAGRLPNRVQLHSLSLSKISLALIKAGLVGAYWTHESFSPSDPKGKRAEIRPIKSSALRGWDSSGLPNVRNQSLATPCVTLAHNPAALSSVNLHEDVREQFFWISAIEIAFEKAWDKVWPLAVQTGEAAAKNLQASSPGAQEGTQTRRPSHTTSSVPCRTSNHPAVSGVIACGTILVRWLTRTFSATRGLKSQQASHHQPAEEHEVNTSLPPPGQASRSKSTKGAKVLKEALGLDQSRPLDDTHVAYNWVHIARRYQQEYHNKKEEALQYSKRVLNIKRNRREGPFFDFELKTLAEEAWKLTQWGQDDTGDNKNNQIMPIWKESWIEAWQAVWDQTWHIGVTKGVEFGMEKVLDESSKFKRSTYIFTKLTSTGSHKKLQEEFAAQDSHFSSLQRFYSMMKELQHIFESHQRCIHNVHHDRVKITNFPAEQVLLPKISHDMQEPKLPYVISHFQLQRLVIEKWVPENARSDFRADIGEVWYLAWSAHQTLHKNSSIARTVTMQKCSGVPIRSKEGSSVEADSHQSKQV
ncbi:hypothetical protein OPQ81_006066 [Rhizoctonia solani]|nr:hypothetical protein OPQ81_006066 [Rhizoctonia solani]